MAPATAAKAKKMPITAYVVRSSFIGERPLPVDERRHKHMAINIPGHNSTAWERAKCGLDAIDNDGHSNAVLLRNAMRFGVAATFRWGWLIHAIDFRQPAGCGRE